MVKPKGAALPGYRLWLESEVHKYRTNLPGKIRQVIKRQIKNLILQPRPATSRVLNTEGLEIPLNIEVRRLRIENWRIIYAVNDSEKWIWVLAIRQRPPYDYEDLSELTANLA